MATNIPNLIGVFLLLVFQPAIVQSRSLTTTGAQSLKSFQNLEGLEKGQTVKGINGVKSYLTAFGYLNNNVISTSNDDEFDELLESGLKLFQNNYHLNVTGKLDSETIKLMMTPRCGEPDPINHQTPQQNSSDSHFHSVLHYVISFNPKWPPSKTHLTYDFNSSAQVFSSQDFESAAVQGFTAWSQVTQFTFEYVPQGTQLDLKLGFHRGAHGDDSPFDGKFKVQAHASLAADTLIGREAHFDADEAWSTTPPTTNDWLDLVRVATHEIGHLLGLAHSLDPDAIMYAYTSYGPVRRTLGQDDINGIHAMYP